MLGRTGALSASLIGSLSGWCCFSPCAREGGIGTPTSRGPRLTPAVVGGPCLGQGGNHHAEQEENEEHREVEPGHALAAHAAVLDPW